MSIYLTPYQTTVGKKIVIKAIDHALKEVIIVNPEVVSKKGSTDLYDGAINGLYDTEEKVPTFVHPFLVDTIGHKQILFMDYRPFVRASTLGTGEVQVKNENEYNLAKARLFATKHWMTNDPTAMLAMSGLPASVFAAWISESIAHRFVMDPLDKLKLAVIASFYYQSLFYDVSEFDAEQRQKMTAGCLRYVRGPANIVFDVTDKIGKLENINDFCDCVKEVIYNPRLDSFNAGILITILKSSWFGNNAAELIAVSLEHPPTWISIIYASISERSYRNANLSKIVEVQSKGGADASFTRSFVSLVQEAKDT